MIGDSGDHGGGDGSGAHAGGGGGVGGGCGGRLVVMSSLFSFFVSNIQSLLLCRTRHLACQALAHSLSSDPQFRTAVVRPIWMLHTHSHTHLHAHLHTHLHTGHTRIHTRIHTCILAYIYTCIHTYIHTCIHTHIHTHPTAPTTSDRVAGTAHSDPQRRQRFAQRLCIAQGHRQRVRPDRARPDTLG